MICFGCVCDEWCVDWKDREKKGIFADVTLRIKSQNMVYVIRANEDEQAICKGGMLRRVVKVRGRKLGDGSSVELGKSFLNNRGFYKSNKV